ncbi:MAG: pseudouridine synthase [Pseudomonadota bacterium]
MADDQEDQATPPPVQDVTEKGERPEGERIAKLLARAGVASRRDVERMIGEGRVRLNGDVVTTPATILRNLRGVFVDGQPVRAAESARLFVFHKPSGLLTAERDPAGRPTIYTALRNALPPGTPRVMPVGRLDLNTEGLLLLTNDGELKRKLELPATGIPRTYRARTFGDISQNRLEELIEGIEIEGVRYAGIDANMERRTGSNQWIELTLTEGKNREVRRVLEHLGLEVSRLLRVAYGPFLLADLPRGAAVEIAPAQVEKFRVELGLPASLRATERPPARLKVRTARGQAPTAGGAIAKARPKPALARRKADPSRPDEALGRRTGANDRSGPRERADPRSAAEPRNAPAQDRPASRNRTERNDAPKREERPPRDWARTNDRKPAGTRTPARPQTERTGRVDSRAAREPAPGTLTTRPRDGDRPPRPGADRPGDKPGTGPRGRPTGKGPPRKGPRS